MRLLALSLKQLKNNLGTWLLVMLQIMAALLIAFFLYRDLASVFLSHDVYTHLEMSQYLFIKVNESDKSQAVMNQVKTYADYKVVLNCSVNRTYSAGDILYFFVDDAYIENIVYRVRGDWFDPQKDYGGVLPMIVPAALASQYKLGETYSLTPEIRAKVIGIMKNNLFYDASSLIAPSPNTAMLYQREMPQEPAPPLGVDFGVSLALKFADTIDMKEIKEKVSQIKGLDSIETGEERYTKLTEDSRKNLGVPSMMGIALMVVSVIGFVSYNSLTLRNKEKLFSLCFICGLSTKNCILIQLVNDFLTISLPMLAALTITYFYDRGMHSGDRLFSGTVLVYSALLCCFIFVITSIGTILKLSKEEPIQIIRRCL